MRMFVVRVVDDGVEADDDLRGIVRRVSDGTERPFHGGEQLVELLGRVPDEGLPHRRQP